MPGDLREHRAGGPLLQGWCKVLPWALAAAVCLSQVYLGALPRGRRRGAGLGVFIGSALNLVLGVPSASTPAPAGNGEMVPRTSTPETSPPALSPAGSRCVILAAGTG